MTLLNHLDLKQWIWISDARCYSSWSYTRYACKALNRVKVMWRKLLKVTQRKPIWWKPYLLLYSRMEMTYLLSFLHVWNTQSHSLLAPALKYNSHLQSLKPTSQTTNSPNPTPLSSTYHHPLQEQETEAKLKLKFLPLHPIFPAFLASSGLQP